MVFTQDWFSHNIVTWKKVLKEFKGKPGLRFLEIGCFEGRATKWLLENILTNKTSSITVIDTFKGSDEHGDLNLKYLEKRFKENVVKNFPSQVHIKKGRSKLILRKYRPGSKYFNILARIPQILFGDELHVALQ